MNIIFSKIVMEDDGLVLNVCRDIDGEKLVFTYDLNNLILDWALDLASGVPEEQVKYKLLKKGVPEAEIDNLMVLTYSNLGKHKKEFDALVAYISTFGNEIDIMYPGWRNMSFDGQIKIINDHKKAKSTNMANDLSASTDSNIQPNNNGSGAGFAVVIAIVFITILILLATIP